MNIIILCSISFVIGFGLGIWGRSLIDSFVKLQFWSKQVSDSMQRIKELKEQISEDKELVIKTSQSREGMSMAALSQCEGISKGIKGKQPQEKKIPEKKAIKPGEVEFDDS